MMGTRARGVDRKLEQKKEALAKVIEFLGGRDRMTDKLYDRLTDRRTFTVEDLRELNRLFARAVAERPHPSPSRTAARDEPDGSVIVFRRRVDGTYQRSE